MRSLALLIALLLTACDGPTALADARLLGTYELTDFWFRFNADTVYLREALPGAHLSLTFDLDGNVTGSGQLTFSRWPGRTDQPNTVYVLLRRQEIAGTYWFTYANVVAFRTGAVPPDSLRWQLHLRQDRRDLLVTLPYVNILTDGRLVLQRQTH